jgi:hypothetical protein
MQNSKMVTYIKMKDNSLLQIMHSMLTNTNRGAF